MSTAILVALISGIIAVASVVLSSYATIRTIRTQHEMELRRHKLDKSEAAEEITSRYRDPLLRSIIDLQGRIYSIVKLDFMQRHLGSGDADQTNGRPHHGPRPRPRTFSARPRTPPSPW